MQRVTTGVRLLLLASGCAALNGCIVLDGGSYRDDESSAPGQRVEPMLEIEQDAGSPGRVPVLGAGRTGGGALDVTMLQFEMLAFADRYLEAVGEVLDRAYSNAETAAQRALYQQIKVAYVTSALNIATEPDPLRSLREFLVFLELSSIIWQRGGNDQVSPPVALRLHAALLGLRAQIGAIAERAFTRDSIATIRELARQWVRDNRGRTYVAFVRFSDLGDAEQRRAVEREVRNRGLLAPVQEAAQEIEELRLVSERAIFLANHMPILLEWQSELLVARTLATPEVRKLLDDIGGFNESVIGLGDDLDRAVSLLSAEREAAIDHFARVVVEERRAMLADLDGRIEATGERFRAGLEQSADDLLPLATQFAASVDDVRGILEILQAREPGEQDEQLDLAAVEATLREATTLSESLRALTLALDGLIATEGSAGTIARVDVLFRQQERRIFFYAVLLVLLASVCVIVVAWLLGRLRRARG